MPNNLLHEPWSDAEESFIRTAGLPDLELAHALNGRFHGGKVVRTYASIQLKRRALGVKAVMASKLKAPKKPRTPQNTEQKVEREETAAGISLRAVGQRISTVDELLTYAGVDREKYEITSQTAKSWDTTIRTEDGPETVQNHALSVDVRPKVNAVSVQDAVQSIIDGAFGKRSAIPKPKAFPSRGTLQAIVIADPHIGKHAWAKETGYGDYDLNLACATLRDGCSHLMQGEAEVRHFWLLGDYFHYDTPNGTTTKGTPLERDGRVQKMIQDGSAVLFDVLEESAKQMPTAVTLVPGNHDTILTWALQRILQSHFRATRNITIDDTFTNRKYQRWGKCLLGLTHGDKAKKLLPSLMAREAASEWGQTTLREIHTGHLHYRRAVDTLEGVTMHQHPALCPPDSWHAQEGFVSDRGMQSFLYHSEGAPIGMRFFSPDIGKPVSRGTK